MPFLPRNNDRVLSTVTFLNDGVGIYLINPFELQRFSYTEVVAAISDFVEQFEIKEKYAEIEQHLPRLFTERKTKEKSQNSFLTSLFSTKRESVDRDNLFEESGYTKSRSNNTAVAHLQPDLSSQVAASSGKLKLKYYFYFKFLRRVCWTATKGDWATG